jgi:hypothetical protein
MSMTASHKAQIIALEGRLNQLNAKLASLASRNQVADLIPIIHRPGWTTVAEMAFAAGIVEAMLKHADAFAEVHGALMKGSQSVGQP